jgi:hypothetical protein
VSQQVGVRRSLGRQTFNSTVKAALWVVQVLTAGMFFLAGGSKLAGAPATVALFDAIGIGQWFRFVTGALEVTGAVALLVPALSGLGGLLLAGVMAGAIATHLIIVGGSPTAAVVLLVSTSIIAYGRRTRTLRLPGLGR